MTGHVIFVGAGPGAADLLTVRALRALEQAEVVLHDALVSSEVLDCLPREALRIDVGKRCGNGGEGQRRIEALLLEHASAGRRVVRLKGGDPALFARLGEEITALIAAGIGYDIVPGITAASAAAAALGIPLTDRITAPSVRYVSASRVDAQTTEHWADGLDPAQTLVVYMGGRRLEQLARDLLVRGFDPHTAVAIVRDATRASEQREQRSLGALARGVATTEQPLRAQATLIIVGEVVRLAPERG